MNKILVALSNFIVFIEHETTWKKTTNKYFINIFFRQYKLLKIYH